VSGVRKKWGTKEVGGGWGSIDSKCGVRGKVEKEGNKIDPILHDI